METSNVVNLPPRKVTGKRGNITWSIIYDMKAKVFTWRVTVPMAPQVFEGTAVSEGGATTQVNNVIDKVLKKGKV